jgi:serpin B
MHKTLIPDVMRTVLSLMVLPLATLGFLMAQAFGDPPATNPSAPAADGEAKFAADLYAALRARPGNLFFSPLSVDAALSMTAAGARGQSAAQMAALLHAPADSTDYDRQMGQLLAGYQTAHPGAGDQSAQPGAGYEIHVANALWLQNDFPFLPAYTDRVRQNYGADLNAIDFSKPAAAADRINAWVATETKNKIPTLVSAGSIQPDMRLILTNAIYFKGDWTVPFRSSATHPQAFHPMPDTSRDVPMMHGKFDAGYVETDDAQALQLNYKGDQLAMLILLPKAGTTLADYEKSLDSAKLSDIASRLSTRKIKITLPKFKLETTTELTDTLQAMGLTDAFGDRADFSGIDGRKDLRITGVIHKAYVNVDEQGTTAAAATGIMVGAMAVFADEPTFVADRPFVFVIRDVNTSAILFMGRVTDLE